MCPVGRAPDGDAHNCGCVRRGVDVNCAGGTSFPRGVDAYWRTRCPSPPQCPTEIIAFSDRHDEFAAIGTDVVLWSVDSVFSHLAWTHVPKTKGGLGKMKIPMIGDVRVALTLAEPRPQFSAIASDGAARRGLRAPPPPSTLSAPPALLPHA